MNQEEIGRKQGQPDQTSKWFQNRGLFPGHFLQARLPKMEGLGSQRGSGSFSQESSIAVLFQEANLASP